MVHTSASRWDRVLCSTMRAKCGCTCPPRCSDRCRSGLLWLPVHLAIIVAIAAWYSWRRSPRGTSPCRRRLIAGHSWACLAFLAHETLHHAVIKNRVVERLVGYCGLGIYCLSPTLWVAWHNQAHHGNTGNPVDDPDALRHVALLGEERGRPRARDRPHPARAASAAPSSCSSRFSLHSLVVLLFHSQRNNYYARISRRGGVRRVRRDAGVLDRRAACWSGRGTSSSSTSCPCWSRTR